MAEPPKPLFDKTRPYTERPTPQADWTAPDPHATPDIIAASYSSADLLALLVLVPNVTPTTDTTPGPDPGQTNDPDRESEPCVDGPLDTRENAHGNITYFPRERFKPGPDGCRATGAIGEFNGPEDMEDGTETAWKNTPRRPMVKPPDYWNLVDKQRARGHLMGRQFGGSGDNLRNLVPLWDFANAPAMWEVEMDIASVIKQGGQKVV
ncbi:DNA/RNA non-specific endonuclease [Kitasatospora sp. NBC_01246]|uniref:DNA/RNA non-specific endonuclease n=1 Tax=Kitasatospora sp. NBC_01246 TaxID=2903570 RepID=UPI002E2EE939|nr:DNA/RNA non-specific endonuclease [Kitasatospora sp. NBC_01246]